MNTELYCICLIVFFWEYIKFEIEIYQRKTAVQIHIYRSIRYYNNLCNTKKSGKYYKKLQKAIPLL